MLAAGGGLADGHAHSKAETMFHMMCMSAATLGSTLKNKDTGKGVVVLRNEFYSWDGQANCPALHEMYQARGHVERCS